VVGSRWRERSDVRPDAPNLLPQGQPAASAVLLQPSAEDKPAATSCEPTCSSEGSTPCASFPLQLAQRPLESSWYGRLDYFVFQEETQGTGLFSEGGALYTLGYVRSSGAKRLRGELFAGSMNFTTGGAWPGPPFEASTCYLGARGEFELIWDVKLDSCPTVSCFAGIGSRFWIRDAKDAALPAPYNFSVGRQENWWTIYPYLGLEKKWALGDRDEIFLSGRAGATAWTYQYASTVGAPSLYPGPGVTSQMELGSRHGSLFLSAFFEVMTWGQSPADRGTSVPCAQTYTVGAKLGLSF
jgi:hypothetical protein